MKLKSKRIILKQFCGKYKEPSQLTLRRLMLFKHYVSMKLKCQYGSSPRGVCLYESEAAATIFFMRESEAAAAREISV